MPLREHKDLLLYHIHDLPEDDQLEEPCSQATAMWRLNVHRPGKRCKRARNASSSSSAKETLQLRIMKKNLLSYKG
jgi:hypothetical protein